jgi:outer membrane protein
VILFRLRTIWGHEIKYITAIFLIGLWPLTLHANDLIVRLTSAPAAGDLIFQVYDTADAFRDFRDPVMEVRLSSHGDGDYLLPGTGNGKIALIVFHDENQNGIIDKNFIGIPREKLAFSNGYQPKGPPNFTSASIDLPLTGETASVEMKMYELLGRRGRFGLGVGAIGQSSPYLGSTQTATQGFPIVTYVGERLQWFGPALRYGIAGSGNIRLAATAEYRIGSYEELDSDVLAGLGDRRGTLMGGLGLQYEISEGFELNLEYQHDLLDRVGGTTVRARLSRGFPVGPVTFVPQLSVNWLSSELSNYDFGVPVEAENANRPAFILGSTTNFELGIGAFVELTEDWLLLIDVSAERLDSDITASPIVGDNRVFKGLAMISYIF